jgi:hypothetical protein
MRRLEASSALVRRLDRRKELLLKLYAKFGLPAFLLALFILLTSCGSAAGNIGGAQKREISAMKQWRK